MTDRRPIENEEIGAVDIIEAMARRLNHGKEYNRRYSVDSFMRTLFEEAAALISEKEFQRQKQARRLI